jgi:hypothetical protein
MSRRWREDDIRTCSTHVQTILPRLSLHQLGRGSRRLSMGGAHLISPLQRARAPIVQSESTLKILSKRTRRSAFRNAPNPREHAAVVFHKMEQGPREQTDGQLFPREIAADHRALLQKILNSDGC